MSSSTLCPVCERNLDSLSEHDRSSHVNACLDQNSIPEHIVPGTIDQESMSGAVESPPLVNDESKVAQAKVETNRESSGMALGGSTSHHEEQLPPLPQRPISSDIPVHNPPAYTDDVQDPINYRRDPHKLVAYLIPFPKPNTPAKGLDGHQIPQRFLIYTPPPPPLQAPKEGEKETKAHKVQRKWENEVRQAKQSKDKLASWKGVKSRATKGIDWAMNQVKSADLEFLNRVPGTSDDKKDDDHKTVGLEEIVLVFPASLQETPDQIRAEFINSMMRTKSKAQKDSIIASGLLPVSAGIDLLATPIWPFGGLLEVDAVWAYSSIRGAKTARSMTKRLESTDSVDGDAEPKLKLTFIPSSKVEILKAYLEARCAERDPHVFRLDTTSRIRPTESDVLEAIAWTPSQAAGQKNWEDEQWELAEVREDLKTTLGKGAKAWISWVKAFEKNPEKTLKK